MKKFEGWRTQELQYVATLMAGRDLAMHHQPYEERELYQEIVREIRNRRVNQELFQMKLEGIEEE